MSDLQAPDASNNTPAPLVKMAGVFAAEVEDEIKRIAREEAIRVFQEQSGIGAEAAAKAIHQARGSPDHQARGTLA